MSATLACAFNIYNDANALPGLLENAQLWADKVFCIHAGPCGKVSNDGTMEILEKWGIKPVMADIADGFGTIRSRLVHECGADWAFILDADERFYPLTKILHCEGTEGYPAHRNPKLNVAALGVHNQGAKLREFINTPGRMAVRTCRRHWFDFSMTKPCQNFTTIPDWQMRILRNNGSIGFRKSEKMHEKCVDYRTDADPAHDRSEDTHTGIFHDHFHCLFKPMEQENNAEDSRTYDLLHRGVVKDMWLNHADGVNVL